MSDLFSEEEYGPDVLRTEWETPTLDTDMTDILDNAGTKTAVESLGLALEEPWLHGGEMLGLFDKDLEMKKRLVDSIKNRASLISQYETQGGNRYGAQMLRHLPETIATVALPLGAYSFALAPIRGGTSWMAGGVTAGLESALYQKLRTGEVNTEATILSMAGGYTLGKFHRGWIEADEAVKIAKADMEGIVVNITRLRGGTRPFIIKNGEINGKPYRQVLGRPNTLTMGDIVGVSTDSANALWQKGANITNGVANKINFNSKASVGMTGMGMLALSESDAEAGLFNFGSKVVGSAEVKGVVKKNVSETEDPTIAGMKIEKELVTDVEQNQKVLVNELGLDFMENAGAQFKRGFDAYKTNMSFGEAGLGRSAHKNKQDAIEIESFYIKKADEDFPLDILGNKEKREAMGDMFKSGLSYDDIQGYFQYGTKPIQDNIDIALSKLDDVSANEIRKYIDAMSKKLGDDAIDVGDYNNATTVLRRLGIEDELLEENINRLVSGRYINSLSNDTKMWFQDAMKSNPQGVRTQFGARNAITSKTKQLIKEGALRQEDAIYGYTKPKYEHQYKSVNLTDDELKSMMDRKAFQDVFNKMFGDSTSSVIKVVGKNSNGTNRVLIKDSGKEFLQGSIPRQAKEARGVSVNVDVKTSPQNFTDGTVSKVDMHITNKYGDVIYSEKSTSANRYNEIRQRLYDGGTEFIDDTVVTQYKRPLTLDEKVLMGEKKDIADISGHTLSSVQSQLGKDKIYRDIKTNYSSSVGKDNLGDFLNNSGSSEKYLFVNPDGVDMMTNPEFMQNIANNYLKINDVDMIKQTGARYVRREYAHDLFGYERIYMTRDKYSMGRYVEELYHDTVDMFRGAVVIKNPVAIVNNTLGMAFTNYAYMYMNYGKLNNMGLGGLRSSYKNYKSFKALREELMFAKANGLDDTAIRTQLKGNPAYELYQRGGLQSLLDDGLLSTRLREAKEVQGTFEKGYKNVFMTEDSTSGAFMRQASDISDITNRINLFDMLVKEGMGMDEAVRVVTDISVDYSKLLSPSLMFARNNGIMPFVTWFSRITPVLANEIMKNPKRFAQLQGTYLMIQSDMMFGSTGFNGDDYIAGVRVESWNAFNSLAPSNLTDVISNPLEMQITPELLTQPEKALGVTIR